MIEGADAVDRAISEFEREHEPHGKIRQEPVFARQGPWIAYVDYRCDACAKGFRVWCSPANAEPV